MVSYWIGSVGLKFVDIATVIGWNASPQLQSDPTTSLQLAQSTNLNGKGGSHLTYILYSLKNLRRNTR